MRNYLLVFLMCAIGCSPEPEPQPQLAQYPSPMSEQVRSHDRVEDGVMPGFKEEIDGILPGPVDLFLPDKWAASDSVDLLIHFHGASYVVWDAVDQSDRPLATAVVNLGSGSSVYEKPFQDVIQFVELLIQIRDRIEPRIAKIYLSSWSAGYGAVRAILKTHADEISGILLLDGLHTDYIPERVTLHEGGSINGDLLESFLAYANAAVSGDRRMVITHSEIFPGTYVSTTETADYLAANLSLARSPVLEWGPVGMQMISRSSVGHLSILGFAGNSAPDHVDHFHGMATFLDLMLTE